MVETTTFPLAEMNLPTAFAEIGRSDHVELLAIALDPAGEFVSSESSTNRPSPRSYVDFQKKAGNLSANAARFIPQNAPASVQTVLLAISSTRPGTQLPEVIPVGFGDGLRAADRGLAGRYGRAGGEEHALLGAFTRNGNDWTLHGDVAIEQNELGNLIAVARGLPISQPAPTPPRTPAAAPTWSKSTPAPDAVLVIDGSVPGSPSRMMAQALTQAIASHLRDIRGQYPAIDTIDVMIPSQNDQLATVRVTPETFAQRAPDIEQAISRRNLPAALNPHAIGAQVGEHLVRNGWPTALITPQIVSDAALQPGQNVATMQQEYQQRQFDFAEGLSPKMAQGVGSGVSVQIVQQNPDGGYKGMRF